jgi:mRNA interferase RelE/StbE
MKWYAAQEHPLSFAKRLTDPSIGTYRFRVGDYRVLCDVEYGTITALLVVAVKHRKQAYVR